MIIRRTLNQAIESSEEGLRQLALDICAKQNKHVVEHFRNMLPETFMVHTLMFHREDLRLVLVLDTTTGKTLYWMTEKGNFIKVIHELDNIEIHKFYISQAQKLFSTHYEELLLSWKDIFGEEPHRG